MSDYTTIDTGAGPFTAIVDDDGVVLASGWTDSAELLRRLIHPSIRPATVTHRSDLGKISSAVIDYHAGDLNAIDAVQVRQASGEFLEHAWEVLRTVRPNQPITYAEFATRAGRPAAVRAAANACGRNAAALFVPCHRVIRTGGGLGGFRYGLPVKRWLLDHEVAAS